MVAGVSGQIITNNDPITYTANLTASADTWLWVSKPNEAHGTDVTLYGNPLPEDYEPVLFQFDLSSIPAGATIVDATFDVYVVVASNGHTVDVYPMLTSWAEATATYNDSDGAGPGDWSTGTFSAADYGGISLGTIIPNTTGHKTLDITSQVDDWVNNAVANRGLVFAPTGTTAPAVQYASKEHATVNRRPTLSVTYTFTDEGMALGNSLSVGPSLVTSSEQTGVVAQASVPTTDFINTPLHFEPNQGQAAPQSVVATYTVVNTNDSGAGSLRQAILDANGSAGLDTIEFNIPGGGVHTITPASALPDITDPVIIDGTTQPGFAGTPIVELRGDSAGADVNGLLISGGNSTVRGLVINRFSANGIRLEDGSNNVIAGNYIGTDVSGTSDLGNAQNGIYIYYLSYTNTIGGPDVADRNVISGNDSNGVSILWARGNEILGNYIGVNASGVGALGNSGNGVHIDDADDNIIGGDQADEGNVISGNTWSGIQLLTDPSGTIVQGNFVGTNATGTAAIANSEHGIHVSGGAGLIIGGATPGAGNIFSGNMRNGIYFQSDFGFIQGNLVGTDVTGHQALGNGWAGIRLDNNATDNLIGGTSSAARNIVAYNADQGVYIAENTTARNGVLGNNIHDNGELGIDLTYDTVPTPNDAGDADTGANGLQNFPVLTSAVTDGAEVRISGTLNSTASSDVPYRVLRQQRG